MVWIAFAGNSVPVDAVSGLKVDEAVGFLRARLEAGASPDGERVMEVMPGAAVIVGLRGRR